MNKKATPGRSRRNKKATVAMDAVTKRQQMKLKR
jgi:hypothetical protein